MPQIFKFGPYLIYFGTNESKPLEPIHVHISDGRPAQNATKIWITKYGKCFLCHNKSKIPERILKNMMRMIEARSSEIIEKWFDYFGEIRYYC